MTGYVRGLAAWIVQRVTAVYMGLFIVLAGGRLLLAPPASHGQWRQWLADPWINTATGLFIMALLLHAWVGVRDVLMDYAKPAGLRIVLHAVVAVGLLACGLWASRILLIRAVAP